MSHLQTRHLTAICHTASDCYMSDLQARALTVKYRIFKQDLWLLYVTFSSKTSDCYKSYHLWLLYVRPSSKTSDCSDLQARTL